MTFWEAIRAMFSRRDASRADWPGRPFFSQRQPSEDDVDWARRERDTLLRRARSLDVDVEYERLGRRQVPQ